MKGSKLKQTVIKQSLPAAFATYGSSACRL